MSKTSSPLVTIGIPTYNGGNRIHSALESLAKQSYPHLEIVISDNGSTDNTQEVIQGFMEEDPRICHFRQEETLHVMDNFAYVFEKATGKYFMWLADDDELTAGVISKYVGFLEENPDYVLAAGEIDYLDGTEYIYSEKGLSFDEESRSLRVMKYYSKIIDGALFYGLMRRDVLQKVPILKVVGMDLHLVASLAFLGKIKQFGFTGYIKRSGGYSHSFVAYCKRLGERSIWGHLPFVKIGIDALREIFIHSPVFSDLSTWRRFTLATACAFGMWNRYYILHYPKMVLGKMMRFFNIKTPSERRRAKRSKERGALENTADRVHIRA